MTLLNTQVAFRIVMSVFALLLLSCGQQTAVNDEPPTSSRPADSGNDVRSADTTADAEPTARDAGRDTVRDATPETDTPPDQSDPEVTECDCVSPRAECIFGDKCGLPDSSCGRDDDCPEGYHCQQGQCLCEGTAETCGPYCEDHSDCPTNEVCEHSERFSEAGFCRDGFIGPNCRFNFDCGAGEACVHVKDLSTCVEAGTRQPGDSCSNELDCASTQCKEGTCIQKCLSDEDCPAGKHCTTTRSHTGGTGCTSTECRVSCPPQWRCIGNECRRPACLTTADCPSGDCVFDLSPSAGHCLLDQPSRCKPNEFRFNADDDHCRLAEPCGCLEGSGTEDDCEVCPDPYDCKYVPNPNYHVTTKLCSRPIGTE